MHHKILCPVKLLSRRFYADYLKAKSNNEDRARKELIFNVLLLGFLAITLVAFLISLARHIMQGGSYENVSPYILIVPVLLLSVLYKLSRRKFSNRLVYVFIATYFLLGTYSLFAFSYALPQGLLTYVLVIIVTGILISARASFVILVTILASLSTLAYLQMTGFIRPYTDELNDPFKVSDLILYLVIFLVIFLISWLSSREIETSLERARKSEQDLLAERNMLEVKIRQRTRELEKAQVEKTLELYRFAEFGRLSSSLLHDLANPLTAVSLNISQLAEDEKKPALLNQVKEGITHMEQYMHSARRQLRSQSEEKPFGSKIEIERVKFMLQTKADTHRVKLVCKLSSRGMLYGDHIKFSQVIANLIANGIDAYSGMSTRTKRAVRVDSKVDRGTSQLIILVRDEGVGIEPDEINRIFEPFFTTKSSDRGTGIGLTITRQIVEKDFKGTIEVMSSKQRGTVFTIALPIYRPNEGSE